MTTAKKSDRASEAFEDAFRAGIGTTSAKCEVCGVHVFASGDNSMGWEPGELEALQKNAKEQPDKYQELEMSDGVSLGDINGLQFVIDHGCEKLGRYERFIWGDRKRIVEYIKKRTAEKKADQERDDELLKGI
jgi:hypothetical protein